MALAPTFAYKISDRLSVGVAPQLYYATLDLDVNVPNVIRPGGPDIRAELDGDDTGFGFAAGFTYEISEKTQIGLNYQSELEVDFDGDLKVKSGNPNLDISQQADSNTELNMAQMVRLGLHHELNDRLGLDITLGWDDWSALDNVFVSVESRGGAGLEKNWGDTYHYAAGFQYEVTKEWDVTAGIAYDTNPVDSKDRTADLPVDRQVRYNAGARYQFSDTMVIGGYVNYTDLGSARITGDFWSGDYSSNDVFSFSVFLNWNL